MAIVNWTGAQGTATMDRDDENHVTGDITLNAGAVFTIEDNQAILWNGSYTITSTTTGYIVADGTNTTRIRFQPNGDPSTWVNTSALPWIDHQSAAPTFDYCDFYHMAVIERHTTGNASYTNCRVFGGSTAHGWYLRPAGGTNSFTNLEAHRMVAYGFDVAPSAGTNSFDQLFVTGCGGSAFVMAPTGGTNTYSNFKVSHAALGASLNGTQAMAITNLCIHECLAGVNGIPTNGSSVTRLMVMRPYASGQSISHTHGSGTITYTEAYCAGWVNQSTETWMNGAGTLAIADSVIASRKMGMGGIVYAVALFGVASSANDVTYAGVYETTYGMLSGGTSNNDYLAGGTSGWDGEVPTGAEGLHQNCADANYDPFIDTDSGNTTSTSAAPMYRGLTSNRTNARATPNKALSISSISSGTPDQNGTTVTFTTGIKARSRLLISTTSGNTTRALAEMTTPWKYHGILDPEMIDFTLPVTSHSHTLVNLKPGTTYYYVIECYDPCGRRFLSAEQSFATTAAPAGGASRSAFAGAGMRAS